MNRRRCAYSTRRKTAKAHEIVSGRWIKACVIGHISRIGRAAAFHGAPAAAEFREAPSVPGEKLQCGAQHVEPASSRLKIKLRVFPWRLADAATQDRRRRRSLVGKKEGGQLIRAGLPGLRFDEDHAKAAFEEVRFNCHEPLARIRSQTGCGMDGACRPSPLLQRPASMDMPNKSLPQSEFRRPASRRALPRMSRYFAALRFPRSNMPTGLDVFKHSRFAFSLPGGSRTCTGTLPHAQNR